jgi:N-acetylmuramic acid 6-phosphate etherase
MLNTEMQPPKNLWIDKMSLDKATKLMLENQSEAISAVRKCLPDINKAINKIFKCLKQNHKSRLFFAGAGTSARIAVQDAVELYPTFGWPKERIAFMIAGGEKAILSSVEGAEDNTMYAHTVGKELKVSKSDILIALAASGNTPFTLECIRYFKEKKALTFAISNNKKGKMLKIANNSLLLDTGYEMIAGSTRLKAATAQKICLNIISSMLMTKLGFVKNGLMTHFIPSNKKLILRKKKFLKLINETGNQT